MTLAAFLPQSASSISGRVDLYFEFLLLVSGLMTLILFVAIFYLVVKYREGSKADRSRPSKGSLTLETIWTVIPTVIFLVMFGWAAKLYFSIVDPPADAAPIYVVAKQWMWKIQHPEGNREIDELHVPVGRPVKLMMTSEDVIHDFFVPAFRVKKDVLPGTYTTLWFRPTKIGRYHFFCSQYCGTNHASMRGWVYVMDPADYQNWLTGGTSGETMAQVGEKLFDRYACSTCHKKGGRGPLLQGVYESRVPLVGGGSVVADDAYLRESILTPQSKLVKGYGPIMPTFQGQLTEMNVLQLIAYIKTLEVTPPNAPPNAQPSAIPSAPASKGR